MLLGSNNWLRINIINPALKAVVISKNFLASIASQTYPRKKIETIRYIDVGWFSGICPNASAAFWAMRGVSGFIGHGAAAKN
jgi:hypothetical protein